MNLTIPAPAKVNLGLEVVGRRPDGFHELCTLMVSVDLQDLVTVTDGAGLALDGPFAHGLYGPAGNLSIQALQMLGPKSGHPLGAGIHIHKRIPAGAGLGGGSGDAAAVLRGSARLGHGLDRDQLGHAAISLGADVPFQLEGGRALVTGIGEEVRRLPYRLQHLAIAWPGLACSTAEVFAATIDHDYTSGATLTGAAGGDGADLPNGLEAAALRRYPELAAHRRALTAAGWSPRLTGTGGAYFEICSDRSQAEERAAAAQALGWSAWSVRTLPALVNP